MKRPSSQTGFALIAALIFMVILSLIGVGLSNSTSSEEKMARNFRDRDLAFAAAEAALRDAELHLSGAWQLPYVPVNINAFSSTCTNGLCDAFDLGTVQSWQPIDKQDFYASGYSSSYCSTGYSAPTPFSPPTTTKDGPVRIGVFTGSPQIKGLTTQPCYAIEVLPTKLGSLTASPPNRLFRITAEAKGRLSNTKVVLQEMYVVADYLKQ